MAPSDKLEPLRQCIAVLEGLAEDRGPIHDLTEDERSALYKALGTVLYPERDGRSRLARSKRRAARKIEKERDRIVVASTRIRQLRKAPIFAAPLLPATHGAPTQPARLLEHPRNCYVCKVEYRELHPFYDALCKLCGDFNYSKRFPEGSLEGQVALITGARVKIGFQASLMLLRAGARVIATTRFPNDAAIRYAKEEDFARWSDRLQIHGLDLRHSPSVDLFALHLQRTESRLDILINNAAQTVRRPPGFYSHLSEMESRRRTALPVAARQLLEAHARCVEALSPVEDRSSQTLAASWSRGEAAVGIRASAALSQLPYAFEQQGEIEKLFPKGLLDADLQQVDLREKNTWRLRLAEVDTAELLEVYLINAVAPFILCGKLKPLMLVDRSKPGHIVNVSAMEGVFSRGTKTDKHPHTNMAKAALNMMTLTSAQDYARNNIYMNAVDTGWVTDEDPFAHAERKQQELDFQPPLDIVDGAARIVDPVFTAVRTGEKMWGNFFKDYRPAQW
ncbi:MAG: SDR family NAD(P)-dependent oxidoreductase [Myxococcaceae bacterium]